ncbi:uncharacterized protein TRIADDRAFT_51542 [Trichoplax adhaerens]|uniref:Rho-GAP domain-containing protein n=1 Tax=Trichoplax adhaerens TaxID=10228 RepID=B3RJP8_TRIAD|nr:hypothetical protein TRIADDRAFT_51542 [Trichoplax adhaerens]EDV28536.1 hypothetical protein TRIADDRAFT_51542 [Trichoplax adhaerens]|eukprot:XP_002107738.1 hypothetical protein TRIADDRAFT_51542 [Trichoplax adhaerens]
MASLIFSMDNRDHAYIVIRQLLCSRRIKVPDGVIQANRNHSQDNPASVLGLPATLVPYKQDNQTEHYAIPTFLHQTSEFLRRHLHTEGLFRKSGSRSRQKILLAQIGKVNQDWSEDANVHDIATLWKQFLRSLSFPVLPHEFHEALLQCASMKASRLHQMTILLLCLLFPRDNLNVLHYIMKFLKDVATQSDQNQMDSNNLALVLTPSLMPDVSNNDDNSDLLSLQTTIIKTLIDNADKIGFIPSDVLEDIQQLKDKFTLLPNDDKFAMNKFSNQKKSKRRLRTRSSNARLCRAGIDPHNKKSKSRQAISPDFLKALKDDNATNSVVGPVACCFSHATYTQSLCIDDVKAAWSFVQISADTATLVTVQRHAWFYYIYRLMSYIFGIAVPSMFNNENAEPAFLRLGQQIGNLTPTKVNTHRRHKSARRPMRAGFVGRMPVPETSTDSQRHSVKIEDGYEIISSAVLPHLMKPNQE